MPYRDTPLPPAPVATGGGIVDDLVRQFADPYAFLRELVQNSIDAGATHIEVRIERGHDGTRTTVADDGTGMSRAIIEGPLLTLFESSKENDPSKIGKYGVGFVSIFAIAPTVVEVASWTGTESWLLRLFGDHSYELASLPPRSGHGTEVTLTNAFDENQRADHEQRVIHALSRWCRHARIPIDFTIEGAGPRRINVPLTVLGAVTLESAEGDERFALGIGDAPAGSDPHEAGTSFAGFYNRGLTLVEETEAAEKEVLRGLRFKADSPRLAHTLSRDGIRRDAAHDEVLARVELLARGPLQKKVETELQREAVVAAQPHGTAGRYETLLRAALHPRIEKSRLEVIVPLVEPIGGAAIASLSDVAQHSEGTGVAAILLADQSSPLTQALASLGRPVVRFHTLAASLGLLTRVPIYGVDQACLLATAPPTGEDDSALLVELARLSEHVGRGLALVRLATFSSDVGRAPYRIAPLPRRVEASETFRVLLTNGVTHAWSKGAALLLSPMHDLVRLARRRARTDVRVAAHLLFRALLLHEGPLATRDVDRLLADSASRP